MIAAPPAAAAWVGDEPVTEHEVAAELARLRAGPRHRQLPPPGTAEARQLRRWVTHRVVLRRLLEREQAARALPAAPSGAADLRANRALLGSAVADVLATTTAAGPVYLAVTGDAQVTEEEIADFYARNADRYRHRERWRLRQAFDPSSPAQLRQRLHGAPVVTLHPDTLLAPLAAAVATAQRAASQPASTVGPLRTALGWHLVQLDAVLPAEQQPLPAARAEIRQLLLDRRRQQVFARWLDERYAALVRLEPGYEHPADPRQPDATHRH